MIIRMDFLNNGYDIDICRGKLSSIGDFMNLERRVLVVTDGGVPKEYAQTVMKQCKAPTLVTVPEGEASKNPDNFLLLLKTMLQNGFNRNDCVVAVGGGVVGDLSGFAAASYMRGIDFYNIPTTLLSQVDSSIGGKTAIDFMGVKNIVGAFYQPKAVLVDTSLLKTLPARQFQNGMAEVIKMAAIGDAEFFGYLENCTDIDTEYIIEKSLNIKKNIVCKDEKESGVRKALNFGHTIGHGIEAEQNGNLFHGECVALGTLMMSDVTVKERLKKLYKKFNLPVSFSGDVKTVMNAVMHDKKSQNDGVTAVVVNNIGEFTFKKISALEIENRLNAFLGE